MAQPSQSNSVGSKSGESGNTGQRRSRLPKWADIPLAILATLALGSVVTISAWSVAEAPASADAPRPPLDMARVAAGHRLYSASCVACHGADGRGIPNLGKTLLSGFAHDSSDEALKQMIIHGRNPGDPGHTSSLPMPPRGGRDDFSDSDIADVVTYLRSLQDPSRVTGPEPEVRVAVLDDIEPEPVATLTPAPASVETASQPVASATASENTVAHAFDPEAALRGKRVFMNCMACHGKNAAGLANLGADLLHSKFVATSSDEELLAFVKKGRLASDPDSIMKLNMPAKGGNPALKDNQIQDVIAYVRSLQAEASAAK